MSPITQGELIGIGSCMFGQLIAFIFIWWKR